MRSRLCERTSLEDDTLIASAQQGDAVAFEELVRRHQEAAFRAAFLVLRDSDEAEDAAQEGLVKAYRAIRSFRLGREFRPWLLRIVINQALTMHRSRRRGSAAAERFAVREHPLPHSIDEMVIDRERARLVWAALESLREQERVIVYLRYFLNLPERELAEYLGCAQGTVKSRLHRALSKLREVVQQRYPQLLGEIT
ncbi:MAG: sigma-70 family RNA polymerase sigma factor [Chloroflexi bacterium]|nr:MAG: sigma-70 family RNA polymerase sigma factor [Chloroflexota bacterium]